MDFGYGMSHLGYSEQRILSTGEHSQEAEEQ
jgi:hypothetical protein